jgi:hypothetical protein
MVISGGDQKRGGGSRETKEIRGKFAVLLYYTA